MKHGRRLGPPQLAALTLAVAMPLMGGVIWVAVRTDWLQHVGAWLCGVWSGITCGIARLAEQLAGIDWTFVGIILLCLMVCCLFYALLWLSGMGVSVLCKWRLSLAETVRAMLSVTVGVACVVAFYLWYMPVLFSGIDVGSNEGELVFELGFFVLLTTPVYWIALCACTQGQFDPTDWRVLLIAPRAYRAYRSLIHNGQPRIFFEWGRVGYDCLFQGTPEWLKANREQLRILTDYYPNLTEWLEKKGVDVKEGENQ